MSWLVPAPGGGGRDNIKETTTPAQSEEFNEVASSCPWFPEGVVDRTDQILLLNLKGLRSSPLECRVHFLYCWQINHVAFWHFPCSISSCCVLHSVWGLSDWCSQNQRAILTQMPAFCKSLLSRETRSLYIVHHSEGVCLYTEIFVDYRKVLFFVLTNWFYFNT